MNKAIADTSISSPPQADKYSTTAQTAKATGTQSFTAQNNNNNNKPGMNPPFPSTLY